MTVPPIASLLCDEFGIRIVSARDYPRPGETRAVVTINDIAKRFGIEHARLVLSTLAETENNRACLDREGLWATSDLVRAYAGIVERRTSDWLEAWDAMPVGDLQIVTAELRGIVRQRGALVGMLHERLFRRFGPGQLDLFDDRRSV